MCHPNRFEDDDKQARYHSQLLLERVCAIFSGFHHLCIIRCTIFLKVPITDLHIYDLIQNRLCYFILQTKILIIHILSFDEHKLKIS